MNAHKEYKLCEEKLITKQLEYNQLDQISQQGKEGRDLEHEIFVLEGMLKVYKKLIKIQRNER